MRTKREDVRNVAIIAHVDHGKTTLVEQLFITKIQRSISSTHQDMLISAAK